MSDWQYRDRLAEQVRDALGDFDDRTQPVIVLVAALRAALDQERADNARLRSIAHAADVFVRVEDSTARTMREWTLAFDLLRTALLSGRGEGGNNG